MKRILRITLGILATTFISFSAFAQSGPYGNEWIDYSKTHYKFKVTKAGFYRITRASLDAAGLPASVVGSNFKLYRDGLEVPVYVSAENMGGSDYIEFAGRGADGTLDKELYLNPAWQPNPNISIFTDTACYFLTYDNAAGHLRYAQTANSIPSSPPAAEAYNWSTTGNYYRNTNIDGPSFDTTLGYPSSPNPGNPFFSPSFQNGEGLIAGQIGFGSSTSLLLATPNVASVAVAAVLNTSICNRTYHNTSSINIAVNGVAAGNSSAGSSQTQFFTANIPSTSLIGNTPVTYNQLIQPKSGSVYDVWGVAYAELKYPRNFDVAGLNYFPFKLDGSSAGKYLEFSNVGGTARLYDVTNRRWYAGDVASGKTRFYIQPSTTERTLILVVDGASSVLPVSKAFQFVNYTQTANQGDYLIVTHNKLMQPVNGVNYIDEYRKYRSSAAGGLHQVQVADVTELYDQFGYGYDTHPMSIKHFFNYAYDNWTIKPVAVNMIGHGLQYEQYGEYYSKPNLYTFPIVPVYGSPGSDVDFVNFGTGTDRTQKLQIGRISVWDGSEVAKYLDKVKAYEIAMRISSFPTEATELWKKKVIHIVGAQNINELNNILAPTLEEAKKIIKDTLIGAKVYDFYSDNSNVNVIDHSLVDSLINGGVNLITYFGHASSTSFFFNLPAPSTFNSVPKVPLFIALGCDVAQMFTPYPVKTLSEESILSTTGGSIGMMATDNYGYTDFLHNYLMKFYSSIAYLNYGSTVGKHMMYTHNRIYNESCQNMGPEGNAYFTQIECQLLTGDPGLPMFAPEKPDFHVSADGISALPANITTTLDSFQLRIVSHNLGRVVKDSVQVSIQHRNPGGTTTTARTYSIQNLWNSDTTWIWLPIDKTKDLGLNKYTVKIDAPDKYVELNEMNNTADFDLFIYSDNLIPIYPYDFSIVHEQGVTLKASTLNIFRPMARYVMEIDTTINFNSSIKTQTVINSVGGVIKWKPNLVMRDSTVYYWRCAFDSILQGAKQWSGSSFIYLAQGSDGWNQSHYYQYQKDGYNTLNLPESRIFGYGFKDNKLQINSSFTNVLPDDNKVIWNDEVIQQSNQDNRGILQIMVIDSVSGTTWKNHQSPRPGTIGISRANKGFHVIEFLTFDRPGREAAIHYLDSVPDGNYIMLRSTYFVGSSLPVFANEWKADEAVLGAGHSLYHTVKNLGFTRIDSFNKPSTFIFMCKKGRPASEFQPVDTFCTVYGQVASLMLNIKSYDDHGDLQSTIIGPAMAWQQLKWKMHASDNKPESDTANINIYGITAAGLDTPLYTGPARDTSLAFIDAKTYPRIRMEWKTQDIANLTAPQLNYWRVLYAPVPEAALNPAMHFSFADSLQVGQQQNFSVAVENLTPIPMDSMLISYKVINSNGVTSNIPGSPKRYRKLPGNDTLNASISFDPKLYPGINNLFVEVNPNNDQPEQYHPNNLGYRPFTVSVDNRNPLLDVTFDGIHILNNDIVSAKPLIKILLKDENNYLALDDTSLLKVSITGQKHATVELPFDGVTCKFIPGQTGASGKNEAVVEINKTFEDDIYTLTVTGVDKSGNTAGTPTGTSAAASYKVAYEVVNKPSVTNVLNYPNPFSTATSFLFTITGSQIPSQFKIQVLSVTGKVVREITKNELGPLHIGRNITEYKWDGRDQFGQLLGNGVYMYRVATSLNGESIEHRDSGGDRFFKNGFGKMYIMR